MNTYGKDVTPIPIEVDKEKVVKEIQQNSTAPVVLVNLVYIEQCLLRLSHQLVNYKLVMSPRDAE